MLELFFVILCTLIIAGFMFRILVRLAGIVLLLLLIFAVITGVILWKELLLVALIIAGLHWYRKK